MEVNPRSSSFSGRTRQNTRTFPRSSYTARRNAHVSIYSERGWMCVCVCVCVCACVYVCVGTRLNHVVQPAALILHLEHLSLKLCAPLVCLLNLRAESARVSCVWRVYVHVCVCVRACASVRACMRTCV